LISRVSCPARIVTENDELTLKSPLVHEIRCVPAGRLSRSRGVENVCPATLHRDAGRVEMDRNPEPPPPPPEFAFESDELDVIRGVTAGSDERGGVRRRGA
jgi:hypothetical protein